MPNSMLFSVLYFLLACALLPSMASAQTLTIGSAEVRRNPTVDIPVQFVPGDRDVVGFQLRVVYDPTIFLPPTCTTGSFTSCGVNHAAGWVSMMHVNFNLAPLTAQTFAHMRFTLRPDVPRGTRALLGAYDTLLVNAQGRSQPFTMYTGRIDVR